MTKLYAPVEYWRMSEDARAMTTTLESGQQTTITAIKG